MRVGDYTVEPAPAGRFLLDGGQVFGLLPKALWSRMYPHVDEQNRIPLACTSLLVCGHGRVILIDAGCGDKLTPKQRQIYGIAGGPSPLEAELARRGVKPDDVTDVIYSHLHFDHAGGTTRLDESGRAVPVFRQARHYVQDQQLSWARHPCERDAASFMSADWEPVVQAGLMEPLKGASRIAPGIDVRVANGHTCGMQVTVIHGDATAGIQGVMHCADMVALACLVPARYALTFDNSPLLTIEEKKALLGEAVDRGWGLFIEHDPFTPLVRVKRGGRDFEAGEVVDAARR